MLCRLPEVTVLDMVSPLTGVEPWGDRSKCSDKHFEEKNWWQGELLK